MALFTATFVGGERRMAYKEMKEHFLLRRVGIYGYLGNVAWRTRKGLFWFDHRIKCSITAFLKPCFSVK